MFGYTVKIFGSCMQITSFCRGLRVVAAAQLLMQMTAWLDYCDRVPMALQAVTCWGPGVKS